MLWKANEVREFLRLKGFYFSRSKGDDEYWVNKDLHALVIVPNRNEDIIAPTMSWMMQRSRIPKNQWLEWKNTK